MGFIKEFKEFAVKGNLVDIAVAFVMGAAFGKVITTFTQGIIAPLISLITGGVDLSKKEYILRDGDPPLTLQWGLLLTNIIDFIIVALVMFVIIKAINSLKRKEEVPPAPPGPSSTDKLLMEIRDALKK